MPVDAAANVQQFKQTHRKEENALHQEKHQHSTKKNRGTSTAPARTGQPQHNAPAGRSSQQLQSWRPQAPPQRHEPPGPAGAGQRLGRRPAAQGRGTWSPRHAAPPPHQCRPPSSAVTSSAAMGGGSMVTNTCLVKGCEGSWSSEACRHLAAAAAAASHDPCTLTCISVWKSLALPRLPMVKTGKCCGAPHHSSSSR